MTGKVRVLEGKILIAERNFLRVSNSNRLSRTGRAVGDGLSKRLCRTSATKVGTGEGVERADLSAADQERRE